VYENTGIYIIRNLVNNSIYIGSAVSFNKRKNTHLCLLRKGTHHSALLQRSFNKHGENTFVFSMLEECKVNILTNREQHYIDTLNPRYNICRIAGNTFGTKRSEETRELLSSQRRGKPSWNKGIPCTEERKKYQSEILSGRPSKRRLAIVQLGLDGEFIAEYASITEARTVTGAKSISSVLAGKRKTSGKSIWKYKAEYLQQ
jgi:group I intron endonuclease